VKIAGVLEIDYSGNTGTTGNYDSLRFGGDSGYAAGYYLDNVVIDTAAFPGSSKIVGLAPNANGTTNEWTPSAGNNYECVDEVPSGGAGDADYTSINAVNKTDLFGHPALPGSVYQIKCVQVQARCVKEGAPTPNNIQMAVRTGGSNYVSGSIAIPASIKSVSALWETNPNTGNPWTKTEVDAAEFGYKAVA
jgi:hypothetical protein